jgi:hypothetical protein
MSITESRELAPLLIAAWADGTICWSRDRLRGGAPYTSARIDPIRLHEVLERLRSKLEPEPARGRLKGAPDASILELAVLADDGVFGLASNIPFFETNPRLVVTDHGIEDLEGRDRASVMAAQSPALSEFRRTWDECVALVWSLVPEQGEPLAVERFEYAWRR